MEELALTFLPFPHIFRGQRRDGISHTLPDRCFSCDRQCESVHSHDVGLCSYGLNYLRIDEDLLIAGIAINNYPIHTAASKKMLRKLNKKSVTLEQLEDVRRASLKSVQELAADLKVRQDAIVNEYRRSKAYRAEIVDLLRPDIQTALSQVHDYRQLITQIVQNVNVSVATEFPNEDFQQALYKSSHETQAIYWSAKLMEKKLEAALYLMYPERISDPAKSAPFRLHGLVHKYAKIYERSYAQRRIELRYEGQSYGQVHGNPDAIGVIPHTFLDNALKYAPSDTVVVLRFSEGANFIELSCTSYGPRIHNNEKKEIFTLFYRGVEAQSSLAEGTGFGLGLAQYIADATGTTIKVHQQADTTGPDGTHRTTFTAAFRKHREGARR